MHGCERWEKKTLKKKWARTLEWSTEWSEDKRRKKEIGGKL